jgi:hypothetical protein
MVDVLMLSVKERSGCRYCGMKQRLRTSAEAVPCQAAYRNTLPKLVYVCRGLPDAHCSIDKPARPR